MFSAVYQGKNFTFFPRKRQNSFSLFSIRGDHIEPKVTEDQKSDNSNGNSNFSCPSFVIKRYSKFHSQPFMAKNKQNTTGRKFETVRRHRTISNVYSFPGSEKCCRAVPHLSLNIYTVPILFINFHKYRPSYFDLSFFIHPLLGEVNGSFCAGGGGG